MLKLTEDLNILYGQKSFMNLNKDKEFLRATSIEDEASPSIEEFYEFYQKYLSPISNELYITKEEFSEVEEELLESLGFSHYDSYYDNKEDKFTTTYRYRYKKIEYLSDNLLSDIIKKLDL